MTKRMKGKTIHGRLHSYYEQGMEGRIEYTLHPDDPADRINGIWPIPIQDGQFLRIFDPDGRILWEGKIKLKPRRRWLFFYQQHDLPNSIWNDFTQSGVPYKKWIAWFWQDPPLRAELTIPAET